MAVVDVPDAQTDLSLLIAAVERGEEVIISRGSTPVAKIVPLGPVAERELGFVAYTVPDAFFEPLPADEIDAWESGAQSVDRMGAHS